MSACSGSSVSRMDCSIFLVLKRLLLLTGTSELVVPDMIERGAFCVCPGVSGFTRMGRFHHCNEW
ncbi:hypothetical protein GCM10023323_07220 [Streptomyces thinghirensis]|uniref:Uncharacterized protein n=1 Tax=Streptomyces thinghirensis TaxID=551547 RepID=A0ABP9SV74_9ACTN